MLSPIASTYVELERQKALEAAKQAELERIAAEEAELERQLELERQEGMEIILLFKLYWFFPIWIFGQKIFL